MFIECGRFGFDSNVLINVNHIVSLHPAETGTTINLAAHGTVRVKEPYEQILALLKGIKMVAASRS